MVKITCIYCGASATANFSARICPDCGGNLAELYEMQELQARLTCTVFSLQVGGPEDVSQPYPVIPSRVVFTRSENTVQSPADIN